MNRWIVTKKLNHAVPVAYEKFCSSLKTLSQKVSMNSFWRCSRKKMVAQQWVTGHNQYATLQILNHFLRSWFIEAWVEAGA